VGGGGEGMGVRGKGIERGSEQGGRGWGAGVKEERVRREGRERGGYLISLSVKTFGHFKVVSNNIEHRVRGQS